MNPNRQHWEQTLRHGWWHLGIGVALFLATLPWSNFNSTIFVFASIGALLAFTFTILQIRTGFWLAPLIIFSVIICGNFATDRTSARYFAESMNYLGLSFTLWFVLLLISRKKLLQLIARLSTAEPKAH